jgi:UDP-N-acetylglucosamine acyltransferase
MCHVAHDCQVGDEVIVINYAGITGHCEIGDRATIGGYTGMVPFTRIGTYAYVGGCSKVTADVPPYTIVDGHPVTARGINVIGLRRGGVGSEDRRVLRAAYRILYRSGLAPHRALERLRAELPATPYVRGLIAFVEGSRRGICGASPPAPRTTMAGVRTAGSLPSDDEEETD